LPLIANIDPAEHQAYNEAWLSNLADNVLTYGHISEAKVTRIRGLLSSSSHQEKALFNYSFALSQCQRMGAPYTLMLEDDVLAASVWYRNIKSAIAELEEQPPSK